MKSNWFEVSREGLRELQLGKPKQFILRELIQNAWDEDTEKCLVEFSYERGSATISVEDDSPEGFRNIADAYTMFGDTYKRKDPTKRGRFNIGEKQALAICEAAMIETTKGTVFFTPKGRFKGYSKREKGSRIELKVKMTREEFNSLGGYIRQFLIPKGIKMIVNGEEFEYREPYKVFDASLLTEVKDGEVLKRTSRKTQVNVIENNGDGAWLYELGIPVQEIDCEYGIDIQQKVPLGIDRETVLPSFLRDVFAEVLNQVHKEVTEETSSQLWIREGMSDDRVTKDAVESVVTKRFGENTCIATPTDRQSVDEALSRGYSVVYGSEMSKEEWGNVRASEIMKSSSELFGRGLAESKSIEPNDEMLVIADYAKRIAKRLLGVEIKVIFANWDGVSAQYGNRILTFNARELGKKFFETLLDTTGLILHELGHENGMHTEKSYHESLTDMAQGLVKIALDEPEFFEKRG